jgi:hypothetical protein
MNHQESEPAATQFPDPDGNKHAEILRQLTRIQNSHAFGNSDRAKKFLSYVVKHAVEGQTELLKERSIGVDLFHRNPSYMTGEDPIVRVNAADVRKRLALYYAEEEQIPEVRIEIPVGSYVPLFHWGPPAHPTTPPSEAIAPLSESSAPSSEIQAVPRNAQRSKLRSWGAAAVTVVLVVLGIGAARIIHERTLQRTGFDDFWAPVFATGQPVLICLPSPVTYALNSNIYLKAGQAHAGMYDSQTKRDNTPLLLDPDTSLKWKDVTPLIEYSVNKDDSYVSADLSALFAWLHKPSQVRIGRDFTYEDLRNSPAVLIGAYDNLWTMQMAAELPIVFQDPDGLVERGGQGRVWRQSGDLSHRGTEDYAIVARLQNSKTGQFLVILGGIGMVGTQAAGKLVSNQGELDAALRAAPAGWQGKNFEMVIESDVIDGSASPPYVVAVKTW